MEENMPTNKANPRNSNKSRKPPIECPEFIIKADTIPENI